ncbi:hypothetical protein CLG96_03425 [Sphingomonas oleivorans]|uniref:PAS domain-containing protein n=2 Tax=Sphingomonas oleivorans TaxID=1735121 RepID=A0A2T5G207_9SPHN|nr:hypothetical protein CLG96_03425 [Sphingomonas oleivorans]
MEDGSRSEASGTIDRDYPAALEPMMEPPPAIGARERRIHARAHDHWQSLLRGRAFPSIAELDGAWLRGFAPHALLIELSGTKPSIAFIGETLRDEAGLGAEGRLALADMPEGSLLSHLATRYPQVLARRAPIDFEAELAGDHGDILLYRGILLPFSSNGRDIDHIYGLLSWKLLTPEALPADIVTAMNGLFGDRPAFPFALCESPWKMAHA